MQVNALEIRNSFGGVLKKLEKYDEPIIIEKNRTPVAVLISIETFKISLVDNNGKSYAPISLHGISNCPKTTFIQAHKSFSWEFEKLEKGISSIDIEEDPSSPVPQPGDWNWWKWKNVTVTHCNL